MWRFMLDCLVLLESIPFIQNEVFTDITGFVDRWEIGLGSNSEGYLMLASVCPLFEGIGMFCLHLQVLGSAVVAFV